MVIKVPSNPTFWGSVILRYPKQHQEWSDAHLSHLTASLHITSPNDAQQKRSDRSQGFQTLLPPRQRGNVKLEVYTTLCSFIFSSISTCKARFERFLEPASA